MRLSLLVSLVISLTALAHPSIAKPSKTLRFWDQKTTKLAAVQQIAWNNTPFSLSLRGRLDQNFTYLCPPNGTIGNVWGTDVYQQWRVYHFHDTSDSAYVKQPHGINDNAYLRPDGRNLASLLYLLGDRYPTSYQKILKTIRLVAPFFGDFYLRPSPQNEDIIELE